ncbi:hypothetical protein EZV62_015811 [Acer yangbiense]|uniref:Uncharacterized protein n=1 Tax=Acer yangbiense TaxID=1000413 RepID=A0A5C7HP64_9ROSI|nr:hypothetical protein EZV62_015811 [Acer yangbiense]
MAEPTKHLSMNGGALKTDLNGLFTVFRTKRSIAFANGFMLGFVAFTALLAFNHSSSNSHSPWFTSIFTTSTVTCTTPTTSSSTTDFSQGIETLMNCDLFDGEWVYDDSYPLYKQGSCSFIDHEFNCFQNGRLDTDYQKMKWKPKGCNLPRNMWESLLCILKGSSKDPSNVFEANGKQISKGETSFSFVFKDYNFSVEFFVSSFLVQEWKIPDKDGSKKETLRLDLMGRSSDQYKDADIIIFNTGHWWIPDKTFKGKNFYQEGSHVYGELNVLEAYRKALTTWARWVDASINPNKSMIFFRGYSASHFRGGQLYSGGVCDNDTEPIKNETYLSAYPPKMKVLESVLKGMKIHVTYLNITRLTDYRKEGHPSFYREHNLSKEKGNSRIVSIGAFQSPSTLPTLEPLKLDELEESLPTVEPMQIDEEEIEEENAESSREVKGESQQEIWKTAKSIKMMPPR